MIWRPGLLGVLCGLAALSGASCVRHTAAPVTEPPEYDYAIAPPAAGSWVLRVEATYERAPSARLVAPEAGEALRVDTGGADGITREGEAWVAPACRTRCSLSYSVDLGALAAACHGHDCLRRVDDAILGTASAWLLRPDAAGDATMRVRTSGADAGRFATGLRPGPGGGFVFHASELGESSYTAFGSFRRRHVDLPGARLDVILLGAPLAMGDAAEVAWIRGAGACVAGLFGRFPVDATLFAVPVTGAEGVVFGRVMSLAGASVVLLFGDRTGAEAAHDDWVVVHELFHLGCPSFVGEGHWLEEGLATYYEPILRERAGWMTEQELWAHFAREMPRGLRRGGEPASLEEREDIDSTYWGGALFALLADVAIRESSHGARSLDDAMRAALAVEGDATHAARVADFLRTGSAAAGDRELDAVYEAWAVRGESVDLDGLWHRLGLEVLTGGAVRLRDDAPLSAVRRAIAAGERH